MQQENSKFGKKIKYDPNWSGPISSEKRRSTDIGFLVFFLVYLVLWPLIGIHAITNADLDQPEDLDYLSNKNPDLKSTTEIGLSKSSSNYFVRFKNLIRNRIKKRYDDVKEDSKSFKMSLYVLIIYLLASVVSSILIVKSFKGHSRAITWIFILMFCIFLLKEAIWRVLTLNAVLELNHPDPKEYILYTSLDVLSFLIVLVLVLIFRKKINIAAEVLREGSIAACDQNRLIWFILFTIICYLGIAVFFGIVACSLLFIKAASKEYQTLIWFFQFFNLFGFLWLINFISAIVQIVVSRSIASWYWISNKSSVPPNATSESLKIAFRYHLGTVALGSIIISLGQWLRAVLDFIRKGSEESGHYLGRCCIKFSECWLKRLIIIFRYINNYAYIMCAVHGTDFIDSASEAFNLEMRNVNLAFMSSWITTSFIFLCQYVLIGCTIIFTISAYFVWPSDPDVYFDIIIMVLLGMMATNPVFLYHQAAVDTIYLCTMEDLERNDGTEARPYLLSENLRSIVLPQ